MYDDPPIEERVESFRVYHGKVNKTLTAPTDLLYAVAPQFTEEDDPEETDPKAVHLIGPLYGWDRRFDGTYPLKNDDVALFVDDVGNYWCAGWQHA